MKHHIAIVDSNRQHCQLVADSLMSLYVVHCYRDSANALNGISVKKPELVLVGQTVGTTSGFSFIKDLRKEPRHSKIPLIMILDSADSRLVDICRDLGIKNYLAKPYLRSVLVDAISSELNKTVEQAWLKLPPLELRAVEATYTAFKVISENIYYDRPILYHDMTLCCTTIVEAVNENRYFKVFDSVRDHDNFIFVHSLHVAALLSLFGRALGMSHDQQVLVATGGFLHDLGKLKISRELLNKRDGLTPEEWDVIRNHVAGTEQILLHSGTMPKGILTIAAQHHERLDGSGYPAGLKAADINQLARMAGVVDVFCGLTDRHAYKPPLAPNAAIEIMNREMAQQLDLGLIKTFQKALVDSVISIH